jgi:hypothetical protein
MNHPSDVTEAPVRSQHTSASHLAMSRTRFVAWLLLLLLGVLLLLASLFDLLADARVGLPSDHQDAFRALAGMTWSSAQQSFPAMTHYITSLVLQP